MKKEIREAIFSLKRDLAKRIREFEETTGLAVREIEAHRTGASDNPPDSVRGIYLGLATKYDPNEKCI